MVPELLSAGEQRYLVGHDTLAWEDDGAWTYVVPDALGSVRQETDATGAVVAEREWTPYGVEVGAAQDGLGYAGEWYDPNLGLQYLRARWYDPQSGTFVAQDPIADNHPYRYANGNPITYSDPPGLDVGCPGKDASECGTETSPLYALGVAACRNQGMSGGCYLWEGARWYVYFMGSQQAASEYIHGTGLAAGEEGRYRIAVAQEWSGYAYGKEWISAPENLRYWPTPPAAITGTGYLRHDELCRTWGRDFELGLGMPDFVSGDGSG